MPRDVTITFSDGSTGQYKGVPDTITPDQVMQRVGADPDFQGKTIKEVDGGKGSMLAEAGRVADKSVRGGLLGLPGLVLDLGRFGLDQLTEGVKGAIPEKWIPPIYRGAPQGKFGDMSKTLSTAGGLLPPVSEPQTSGGKAIANVLEPTIGTVAYGGAGTIPQKAGMGFMSGLGGEGFARAFGDNIISRLLGSIVGGGTAAVAQAMKPNATTMMRQSTEHMTPGDWKRAYGLEDTLNTNGVEHLKSQLLGPRSSLDDVVALAGSNPAVRPGLMTATANVPKQANQAFSAWKDQNLPVAVGERRELLNDIQGAATQALRGIRNKANNEFKAAMPGENLEYPADNVMALREQLINMAKSPTYGETTDAGKAIIRYADDLLKPGGSWDFSKVNPVMLARAKKAGTDLTQLAGAEFKQEPVTNAHQINNLIKEMNLKATSPDYKGLPQQEVKDVMKAFTDADFGAARAAKTQVMTNEYNPMARGLAGDIAGQGGGVKLAKTTTNDQAISMVFHKDRAQPEAIKELEKSIGSDGVGTLLREYLSRGANSAFSEAPNEATAAMQPKHFVDAVIGSPAQKANVDAGLDVVARGNGVNPAEVKAGFNQLMDAFRSFKDLKLPSRIDQATAAQVAGANPVSMIVAPHSRFGRFWNDKVMTKTYQEIANIVTSPDGLKKLQAIATSPKQDMAQQLAVSILTSSQAGADKTD